MAPKLVVTYEQDGVQDSAEFDSGDYNPYNMDIELPLYLKAKYKMRDTPRVKLISVYDPDADELTEFAADQGGQWVGGK